MDQVNVPFELSYLVVAALYHLIINVMDLVVGRLVLIVCLERNIPPETSLSQ